MALIHRIKALLHRGEEKMKRYVGVDLHKTQFTVYLQQEGRAEGYFRKYPTTEKGYEAFFSETRKKQETGEKIIAAVESTGNTRYFKNRLEREGIEVKVINSLRFKVIRESVKKTDKHDAKTITEFLMKDMLPESKLCSEKSEELRRVVKARKALVDTIVSFKNQVQGMLVANGLESKRGWLNSKKGRQRILDTLLETQYGLVAQSLIESIERLTEEVKKFEQLMDCLTEGDRVVEILKSIPGTGRITAITARAYIDDIKRFDDYKKFSGYCGLVPWVQCSNTTERYGKITKRGPKELRTAIVQMVIGMVKVMSERESILMSRYEVLKKRKGSGKSIVATARKLSKIIWVLLQNDMDYDSSKMHDKKLINITKTMREVALAS